MINQESIVFAAGVASKNLPIQPKAKYVLHNVESQIQEKIENFINLQVHTNHSTGKLLDDSIAKWDCASRTLYQPWGLPEPNKNWLPPNKTPGKIEYWIGAIWNNSLNQGNILELESYRESLKLAKIHLRRLGGTRSFSKSGISPLKALLKINKSPVGAAIVGEWQRDKLYVPCRAFKNIAAGALPISNSNLKFIFGDAYLYEPEIPNIVKAALEMNLNEKIERSNECKNIISKYSYEQSINRIIKVLM